MTGWTLFFTVVGITTCAAQLFRIIDWIEGDGLTACMAKLSRLSVRIGGRK